METGLVSDFIKRYPDEWLLIDILKLDEMRNPYSGKLLGHSPSREAIDEYTFMIKDQIKFPCVLWSGCKPKKGYLSLL